MILRRARFLIIMTLTSLAVTAAAVNADSQREEDERAAAYAAHRALVSEAATARRYEGQARAWFEAAAKAKAEAEAKAKAEAEAQAKAKAAAAAAAKRQVAERASRSTTARHTPPGGIAACIRWYESGGNYQAQNKRSSASGAYQFLDGTWHSVTGLPGSAKDYPPDVQDAAFWKLWNGGKGARAWVTAHKCGY